MSRSVRVSTFAERGSTFATSLKNNSAVQLTRNLAMRVALAATVLGLASSAYANAVSYPGFPTIHIKNFGQMDEHLYRGAQPKEADYVSLSEIGIKTIIDLRDDPAEYAATAARAAGLNYINLPMSDTERPQDQQIDTFLKIVSDTSAGPFYVHCAGGRHRTGVIVAVYRAQHDSWNYDQAYQEMKAYDYYSRWGHAALGKYVQDYYQRLQHPVQ